MVLRENGNREARPNVISPERLDRGGDGVAIFASVELVYVWQAIPSPPYAHLECRFEKDFIGNPQFICELSSSPERGSFSARELFTDAGFSLCLYRVDWQRISTGRSLGRDGKSGPLPLLARGSGSRTTSAHTMCALVSGRVPKIAMSLES